MSSKRMSNKKKDKSPRVGAIHVPTVFLERFMGDPSAAAILPTLKASRCSFVGVFRVNAEEKKVVNVIVSGRSRQNIKACLGELSRRLDTINGIATTINSRADAAGVDEGDLQRFLNPHHSGCQCCEEN